MTRVRRVLVVGMSGAGKTTAARRIAAHIGAPFHEMDALAWGPRWTPAPDLVPAVARIVAEPVWVFDSWGYAEVRDVMWAAADTIVWLDYPARIVLPRLIRRSLRRSARRTVVFGGNRETWSGWLDREHPVWQAAATMRSRRFYLAGRTGRSQNLRTVRLMSPAELDRWIADIPPR
jgi:adenylate kinase family enzyme